MGAAVGKAASQGKDPVIITVSTGNVKGAGTDNDVMIKFMDVDGNQSKTFKLDNIVHDEFEKGKTDYFTLPDVGDGLGEISCIEVWREGFLDDDLLLNVVFVKRIKTDTEAVFPVHRWILKGKPIRIRRYDSFLPKDDPDPAARRLELEWKRNIYELKVLVPGLPPQCSTIPKELAFSTDYKGDMVARKRKLFLMSKIQVIKTSDWETLEDSKKMYTSKALPLPKCAAEDWHLEDEWFGEQRLSGCNPLQIKLCAAIPSNFAVTSDMIEPFLEGKTMAEALERKKLFLTDYAVLIDLKKTYKEPRLVAPLGLFYHTDAGKLLPVAIQIEQDPGENNPVFLPNDPPFTWTMAKMWHNLADASLHQAKAHLGFTHLIGESICVVTNRQLSPSHPVFRLLAPHFLFLIAINHQGLGNMLSPGGWIDQTMTIGRVGVVDIVRRSLTSWRMNVEGTIPADIKERGVGPDVLPHYPYRDDAMALHDVIKDYVKTVILSHYDTQEILTVDEELQAWVDEMAKPVADSGAGFQGVPGGGKLTNTEDLIDIVTSIIFTCSVQHAAVNFNQYEQYAFPANYPTFLKGNPPTNKDALTEVDVLNSLLSRDLTAEVMMVASILSHRGTNSFGDFEVHYGYDDIAQRALTKLREDLKKARKAFLERNNQRQYSYTVLDPANIPNAISI